MKTEKKNVNRKKNNKKVKSFLIQVQKYFLWWIKYSFERYYSSGADAGTDTVKRCDFAEWQVNQEWVFVDGTRDAFLNLV